MLWAAGLRIYVVPFPWLTAPVGWLVASTHLCFLNAVNV